MNMYIKTRHLIGVGLMLALLLGMGLMVATHRSNQAGPMQGEVRLPDGSLYRGELVGGLFEGQGRLEYSDGRRYEGTFRKGLFHGVGRYQLADGSRYQGEFVEGVLEGAAEYQSADGETYRGAFKAGLFDGQGTYRWEHEQFSGTFVAGALTGAGEYRTDAGRVYQGQFEDWLFSGAGTLVDESGNRYSGDFHEDELNGYGTFEGADGSRYQGEFREGVFEGEGVYHFAEGGQYQGSFRDGLFHGAGTVVLAEPVEGVSEYSGRWQDGELITSDQPEWATHYGAALEAQLYGEGARLEQALDALRPGQPGVPEAYLLAVAGDGGQRVFGREVDYVTEQLAQRFGDRLQSLKLVNDRTRLGPAPLATRTSIARALERIGAQMNVEEDLLLLYMTSHGSRDHELALDQPGLDLPDLSDAELGALLDASGIRWKLAIISSCYSGGFIPYLENDTSLVITAAAADRSSFGCSDEAELTDFARALFARALPHTGDWHEAFAAARGFVRYWESERNLNSSNPQLAVGVLFDQKLAEFEQVVPDPSVTALMAPEPVKRSRLAQIGTALMNEVKKRLEDTEPDAAGVNEQTRERDRAEL